MGKIAVLSEELINKIAAGEVVERPASVIKELAENSLDAGARTIRVRLRAGGRELISVADDGSGMSPDDAELALMRHATSKLRELEDLSRIASKGFRGEALPAIASVSRFRLTTAEPDARIGTRIQIDGGGPLERAEAPPLAGTTVEVEDLFFNVPARRKFMRRDQTELTYGREAVIRLALAHPEVGFSLEHDGNALLSIPPTGADLRERIAAALTAGIHPHLVAVEERRLGASVTGQIALPDFTLPSARGLYTFVNRRYVRDRGLNHAIQRAFRDSLPAGRQPVAILFIALDPRSVDVNVHPQKLEVRFADAGAVYDAVFFAIRRALAASAAQGDAREGKAERVPGAHYALAVEQFLERAQDAPAGWLPIPSAGEGAPSRPAFGEAHPDLNEAPPPGYFLSLRYLGRLGKRFLVCEGLGASLVAIDSHAAWERVRLCAFHRALERNGSAPRQRALFPSTVTLPAEQARVIAAHTQLLEQLDVEIEPFGGGSIALRSVPIGLLEAEPSRLLGELASVLSSPDLSADAARERALQVMACQAADLSDREMTRQETDALFSELERCDFQLPCIHGSVVALEIPLLDIEARCR